MPNRTGKSWKRKNLTGKIRKTRWEKGLKKAHTGIKGPGRDRRKEKKQVRGETRGGFVANLRRGKKCINISWEIKVKKH